MLRTRKRIGAALLAAALVFSQLGATAYAVESPAGTGLCEHHAAHDAAVCGYVEAIPGRYCEHEHTPECYTDELICGMDEDAEQTATDSDAGHTHGQACYALDCPHERGEHTTDCGYIEAVPGTPCGYFCEVCAGEPDKDSGREEPTISENDLTAPVETGTETGEPEDTGTITVTAFDQLDEAVQFQTVPAGTKLESLTLPATLGASGYTADDAPEAITIKGVTWEPDSPWDDTAEPGGYLFTPVLPAGYKLADGVELPEIDVLIGGAVTFALQGDVLTVTFASNGTGGTSGTSMNDNDMKTAIDAALSGDDKANVATIKLIGDVTEITGYNWRYLKEQYNSNSGWDSLTALDLSSMTNLEAIRQDTGSSTGQATKLTRLTLPDSVTQIGDSAFEGCTGLDDLTIPASVESIGSYAFYDCTNLKKVTFEGKTAPSFDEYVFGNITPQPTVYVPEGATGYPDSLNVQTGVLTVTFASNGTGGTDRDNNEMKDAIETALTNSGANQANITTIKLTGSMTEITVWNWKYLIDQYGESSGWDNLTALDLSSMGNLTTVKNDSGWVQDQQTKLQTLTLPDSVTQIGDSAFSSCTGITLTELPGGLEQIEPSAFYGCTGITLTELPGGVTQIGASAFYGCTGITLTELPDGVTQIEGSAFYGCTGITLTELPDGVEQIGDFAFYGCTGLDKIIMEPTTAPTINNSTFENTSTGLTFYVPKGGTGYDNGGWENLNTVEYSPVTSISLPATLELRPNGSGTLTTTFIPSDATFKEVIWESSDTNIVAVDQDGNVTAVSNGTATITATSRQGRKTATCTVTVKDAPPVTIPVIGVTLNHSAYTLHTDKDPRSFQLIATVEPSNASNKAVSWQSNDTGIATVDASGNVTAVKEGTATITVTTTDGSKTATCTVTVKTDSSGGGGNSGGGSSHYITTTPEPPKPNHPVLAVIELPVSVGNGTATGKPDDGRTAAAIAEAGKDAKAKTNGIAVQYDAKTSLTYDGFSIVIQRVTLDRLIAAKVQYVTLNTGVVDMTFDLAALGEIQKQATGDITLTAARETGLTGDALAAVGSRPAYRLTVNYTGADGKAATVQSFGAGRVTVGLAYKPAATEQTGGLYLVYSADGKGAEWLYQSGYDRNSGNVIGSVGHFSVYAVGHRPAPAFTDTVNHWAKADIDFVVSRGLLAGTGDATFTPDGTTTRGMFVVALGWLAGIDPAAYPSSRFTDVAATAYYAPYVEWAASKGIVSGTGDKTFSPDTTITREQMAAIMQRYADKLGYTLPVAREAEIFADEGQITSGMKNAVQAIQQAGIMNGKGNNRFGPKDTATRAEAAAVLRRFVEIVIDPAAGGWGQNDAGKWLYYENNKPVTGWKQIDGTWYYFDAAGLMQAGGWQEISGKWYYFYPDGAMASNTKIDGYEIGPDGARKE